MSKKSKINFSWVSPKVRVGKTKYGKGVFAEKNIKKGERVIVFGGYVMTLEQLEKQPEYFREYFYQIEDDLYFGPKKTRWKLLIILIIVAIQTAVLRDKCLLLR